MLKTLPDTPERGSQELTLQLALGAALIAVKGYTAPEVEKAVTRARELCQQLGETPQLFWVLGRLFMFYVNRRELPIARELAEQMMRLAHEHPRPLSPLDSSRGTSVYIVPAWRVDLCSDPP